MSSRLSQFEFHTYQSFFPIIVKESHSRFVL